MSIHFDAISWVYLIPEVGSLLAEESGKDMDLDGIAKVKDRP
jgi:hypothetical protein